MKIRHAVLLTSVLALSLAAVGCVTTGSANRPIPAANSVSVNLLMPKQVRSDYGYNFAENPFVAPGPTMGGVRYDFLVVRLTVRAAAPEEFALRGTSVTDLNGRVRATFASRSEFTLYVRRLTPRPGPSEALRADKVGWYYLPADRFQAQRGEKSYVMVFVGQAPIGNGVTINLETSLAGKSYTFHLAVPPNQAY